ncbi:MAG: hypothetical protein QOD03_113, partial [Verrucomicrobiota bacterium]
MIPFRFSFFVIGLAAVNLFSGCRTQHAESSGWEPLFDGKSLKGWHVFLKDRNAVVSDTNHLVQVHEGEIQFYKDAEAGRSQPSGCVMTDKEFSNYHLRLEYKWGEKKFSSRPNARRNSGLLYHCGADKVWPDSVQCQIQEEDTGDLFALSTRVTSSVDPATTNAIPVFLEGGVLLDQGAFGTNVRFIRNPMNEHAGWNTVEIIVRGDSATHIVNGKVNNRCSNIRQKTG